MKIREKVSLSFFFLFTLETANEVLFNLSEMYPLED